MFRVYCNNKGCGRDMEPLLNLKTDSVECTECGKDISNITSFTKVQMKSLGQVKRDVASKKAFAVRCNYCTKESTPKLVKDKVCCSMCDKHLDYLSSPFVIIIKEHLSKKSNQDLTIEKA